MTNQTLPEAADQRETATKSRNARKQSGVFRLLSGSAIAASLVLPIGVVPRLMQSQELEKTHEAVVSQIPSVNVATAKLGPAERELLLPGSIEAIVETPIYARTNGYVRDRKVDIGDRVKAGELLARIDTPEVDQTTAESQALVVTNIAGKAQSEANRDRAQADLDTAIASLSEAKASLVEKESEQKLAASTYQRWKVLGQQGAVSLQDVDERETKLKTTIAEKEAAENRVRAANSEIVADKAKLRAEFANINASDANVVASKAREKRSEMEKGFQNVVSPFAGIITERNFDTGTLVTSGSENSKFAMYRLARIDTVKVYVDVPQYASSGIRVGQQVNVSLKEFPNRKFVGIVARTAVALDQAARTMRTEIHLPNSDLALAPGMYTDVRFEVPRPKNILMVPANSVVTRGESSQTAVLAANNKVHYRSVILGDDLGKEIEVTSGLKAGDKIVINPSDNVVEGVTVSIAK